ncbi:phosphatidylglycerol lysyltransferase domain-containing protein [Ramlibacter tataouinensis]|uniref:phosphatidylglycerol lysyltransferase domain-containing protein n=1 Tax=Ramlibacter tataouinensis TaxID=94132 RepID=UPI0022F38521|nr:phosphatidylglycerol lysyltransferase domain-containing protein [Ramlibacter tataouinensis]WBY02336.1 phosphatidylglycerol lysyltransferase domain-containing protein [Ramlibacter tataouinensis]
MAGEGVELTLQLAPRVQPLLQARIAGLGERAPADLSYCNLWLFRRAHGWRFHEGEWPLISGRSYDGDSHVLPLFDLATAPAAALQDMTGRHGSLFPLSGREIAVLDPLRFRVDANPDDADYVYPAEQFRRYPGRVLHKKRNLMAQFTSAHAVTALPYAPTLRDEALAVLDGWLADKHKQPGEADDLPCREALAHAAELGLEGFMVRADGAPAGFLLAEELQPGAWVIRFAKGLARYTGVAQYLFQHFALHAPRPAQWLNFEQDLGLPNFRRTKQSYQPAFLLPKWRASQLAQDREGRIG